MDVMLVHDNSQPLGTREKILSVLRSACENLSLSEPLHTGLTGSFRKGDLFCNNCHFEFYLTEDEIVKSLSLEARGDGSEVIQRLCQELNCRALEASTGEFIDFE